MKAWEFTKEVPRLDDRSCQVWWARVTDVEPRHAELLSEVEKVRSRAYREADDRARFILGCALSRLVLSALLRIPPREVPLDRTCPRCGRPHGKPRLPTGRPQLSVSHSGDRVAVAVTMAAPVGVDVERVHASFDIREMAEEVLTDAEFSQVMNRPCRERLDVFFTYWTRKESVLKATGEGLSVPLRGIAVSGPGEGARLLSCEHHPRLVETASLFDLNPGTGYRAALTVLHAPPVRIRELDGRGLLRSR